MAQLRSKLFETEEKGKKSLHLLQNQGSATFQQALGAEKENKEREGVKWLTRIESRKLKKKKTLFHRGHKRKAIRTGPQHLRNNGGKKRKGERKESRDQKNPEKPSSNSPERKEEKKR